MTKVNVNINSKKEAVGAEMLLKQLKQFLKDTNKYPYVFGTLAGQLCVKRILLGMRTRLVTNSTTEEIEEADKFAKIAVPKIPDEFAEHVATGGN